MASRCDDVSEEKVQKIPRSKQSIKAHIQNRISPANYSLNGVIQIHGASNVHLGNNVNISQGPIKAVRPAESDSVKEETLTRLLSCREEMTQRLRSGVSGHVGSDWRFLGKELAGFSNSQMDHFEEYFKAGKYDFQEMVYQMLLKWEDSSKEEPTVALLARALRKCGMHDALRHLDFLLSSSLEK